MSLITLRCEKCEAETCTVCGSERKCGHFPIGLQKVCFLVHLVKNAKDISTKRLIVAALLILWPVVSMYMTLFTALMVAVTFILCYIKTAFQGGRELLWGPCEDQGGRKPCLSKCCFVFLFPLLVVGFLATVYTGMILGLVLGMLCFPFHLIFGWLKFVYLLCTLKNVWEVKNEMCNFH